MRLPSLYLPRSQPCQHLQDEAAPPRTLATPRQGMPCLCQAAVGAPGALQQPVAGASLHHPQRQRWWPFLPSLLQLQLPAPERLTRSCATSLGWSSHSGLQPGCLPPGNASPAAAPSQETSPALLCWGCCCCCCRAAAPPLSSPPRRSRATSPGRPGLCRAHLPLASFMRNYAPLSGVDSAQLRTAGAPVGALPFPPLSAHRGSGKGGQGLPKWRTPRKREDTQEK